MPPSSRSKKVLVLASCVLLPLLSACTHPAHPDTDLALPPLDTEIGDVVHLPQTLDGYAEAAGERLQLPLPCPASFSREFEERYFRPWHSAPPGFDLAETRRVMEGTAASTWYGVNRRRVERKLLREILHDCALETFPSRDDLAIAVAPGHLRGLPTALPLFESARDYPFDKLQYPQVKLNEPLRVLHASRDGVWLFVESPYSNGWLHAGEVALVDRTVVDAVRRGPHLVMVRDFQKVDDSRGAAYRAKIGTLFPLAADTAAGWRVLLATAGEGGRAQLQTVQLPHDAAAPFPLPFGRYTIPLIADQLAGQPYGWGEIYGLRDCSALLRDFFLPFGIWLPRTSSDQIESVPRRVELSGMTPAEKEETLKAQGVPFLTLLYKPGHIMLYLGTDPRGRPLVWHAAWSIKVRRPEGDRTLMVGKSVVTSLEPGKELDLVPGSSLLERVTAMVTLTERCAAPGNSPGAAAPQGGR